MSKEEPTKDELYELAKERDLPVTKAMKKEEIQHEIDLADRRDKNAAKKADETSDPDHPEHDPGDPLDDVDSADVGSADETQYEEQRTEHGAARAPTPNELADSADERGLADTPFSEFGGPPAPPGAVNDPTSAPVPNDHADPFTTEGLTAEPPDGWTAQHDTLKVSEPEVEIAGDVTES